MTKIVCVSDTHNKHADLSIMMGDVLIHAGDMTGMGTYPELTQVAKWFRYLLEDGIVSSIVTIPGNHDFLFEDHEKEARDIFSIDNRIHILINQQITIDGMKFWGTPVTRRFYDWAFNVDPDKLQRYWDMIPTDTDVLITHQPPYGTGDWIHHVDAPGIPRGKNKEHLGCPDLRDTLQRIQPRLHVWGHIHSSYGQYRYGRTIMVNASILDEKYHLTNDPIIVDI